MNISIVTGFFLPVPAIRGGATERSWDVLSRSLAAQGHTVTFISRRVPQLPWFEIKDGVRHVRIAGFNHRRSIAANLLLDVLWGVKVAFSLPRADVVICNTVTLPVWLNFFRPKAGKVAVMIGRIPKGQSEYYWGVSRIYVPSTFVAELVSARGVDPRVRVIGYPIDCSSLRAAAAQKGLPVNIGFAGRIHPEKGISLLLRAARRLALRQGLPPWQMTIIGPVSVSEGGGGAEWVDAQKTYAEKELPGRVTWLPPEFDPARLASVYGSMDVFCYPSLADRGETFGVSVAEAMAAGSAVVVSSLQCFGDLVTNGDTGLIFDHTAPDSEALLEKCLLRLVEDERFRRAVAANGQRRAGRFDYPSVSANISGDLTLFAGAQGKKSQ